MIKAVIFDLDGTLANSIADLTDAANYALGCFSLPLRREDEIIKMVGNGNIKMLSRASLILEDNPEIKKLKSKFDEYYNIHFCDKTSRYDGVEELLDILKSGGIKLAVVTNKDEGVATAVVKKLYGERFDIILGKRDNIPSKPDPAGTKTVMKEFGFNPNECIFIGDSGVDVETGLNSGAVTVGETWGFRDREELVRCGAVHIIDKPKELLNVIALYKD